MSGCFSGVKARIQDFIFINYDFFIFINFIQEIQPLAVYTYYVGHVLNLVVVDSCENPFIRDTIDQLRK